jgi:hypothetical protein
VFLHIHRQNNVDLAFVLYDRDRKKEFAPNYSAYYPFGVDVFLSPRKVDHIARFVELPSVSSSAKFPPILVVNVQVLIHCLNLLTLFRLFRQMYIRTYCCCIFLYSLFCGFQIPLYPTTLFQAETDGEGASFVLYFKLSESYAKELPLHFQENIRVSLIPRVSIQCLILPILCLILPILLFCFLSVVSVMFFKMISYILSLFTEIDG